MLFFPQSKSVSSIRKVWFKVSSSEEADSRIVELYIDTAERFSTRLLDFVVNLADSNGNTAMHYSISFQNFDVVSVLLDSKVCDVNKYNRVSGDRCEKLCYLLFYLLDFSPMQTNKHRLATRRRCLSHWCTLRMQCTVMSSTASFTRQTSI